mgnify:CR=1 FL=1
MICEATVRKKIRNQFGGRLKAFVSGGGALDKSIGEFLNAIGLPTLQGYGLTEASPVVSCNLPNKVKVETVGPAFSTNQVKIAEDGEILIKGENVMLGYWNKKEATDESIKDGWLHTGDIALQDEDGFFFITGRIKELIIKGGENIAPREIDEALYDHPAVLEAAGFGIDDTRYGQEVMACVALKSGAICNEEELAALLESKLGVFKSPKRIYFMDELPKGPSGKIQRLKLPEMIQHLT